MGGDRTWRFDCITVGRFHQPPAQSKERNRQTNLSSSLISVSMSNVYLKPEQPPPSTETRRKLSLSSANILWSCQNTINSMFSSVPFHITANYAVVYYRLMNHLQNLEVGCLSGIWFLNNSFLKYSQCILKNVETLLKFSCILIFCCGMVWYGIFPVSYINNLFIQKWNYLQVFITFKYKTIDIKNI